MGGLSVCGAALLVMKGGLVMPIWKEIIAFWTAIVILGPPQVVVIRFVEDDDD